MNKNYCVSHLCIIKGCGESAYSLMCVGHSMGKTQCRDRHCASYNDCDMIVLTKTVKENSNIDWKILWIQISKKNTLADFALGFKQLAYSLLYVLKHRGLCKDLRQLIFYEYLSAAIQFYFSKKCYKCVRICSQETCGAIGWPYNPTCNTHVCKVKGCSNVKYKTIHKNKARNKLYDVCFDHKCKKCPREVHSDTKYCHNCLCPLCRKIGTRGNNHFCKSCRCKYRVENKYGKVRCVNPIIYGSNHCSEHQQ